MPLWKIYHPVNAFTPEDKQVLAERITKLYSVLPTFYVGIVFQDIPKDSFFIGGKPTDKFVRIWVDHIARKLPTDEHKQRWVRACDDALAPFVRDRGYSWEFHIDETPFDLWSIQGMSPPVETSDRFSRWKRDDAPTPDPAA